MPDATDLMPGAEPFSADGGPDGVLVLHGFTGNPQSMRGLAEAFAAAGFAVELPLLPGHGTTIDDMLGTEWADWSAAAEEAYRSLRARCPGRLVVAGLSMGGTLTAWLGTEHPEIAGLVLINAAIDPPAPEFRRMLQDMLEQGHAVMPGIGSDIADPDSQESSYDGTPIAPLLTLIAADDEILPRLGEITCPVLIMTSTQDHVVPPISSDILAMKVSGPVERVTLERSYHVATLDYDKDIVFERAVEFARKVSSA
jgi:carboxylesterase